MRTNQGDSRPSRARSGRRLVATALLAVTVLVLALAGTVQPAPRAPPPRPRPRRPPAPRTPSRFDGYSFMIDGQRTYLWSGEFHYFRLPSPDLWLDIFQKMKAAGFNATSLYFDWGYHSPAPGVYDFTGVRDVDKLLDMAQEAGHLRDRPPGAVHQRRGRRRRLPRLAVDRRRATTAAATRSYLKYSDEWQTQIDRIIARHQLTNGTGSVIAYQVENEYYNGSAAGRAYMKHLEDKAARGRHHRAADRQQQRHLQLRRRRARRRRRRLLPAGLQLLQPDAVERRPGHQLRPPRGPAAVHAGVPGRRVRPVGRPRLRQVRAADQRPVRRRLLQAEHRRRRDRAELLHDLRRHQLGLARRCRRTTPPTTTARRSARPASSTRSTTRTS